MSPRREKGLSPELRLLAQRLLLADKSDVHLEDLEEFCRLMGAPLSVEERDPRKPVEPVPPEDKTPIEERFLKKYEYETLKGYARTLGLRLYQK